MVSNRVGDCSGEDLLATIGECAWSHGVSQCFVEYKDPVKHLTGTTLILILRNWGR